MWSSLDDVKSTVQEIMDAQIIQEAQASSIVQILQRCNMKIWTLRKYLLAVAALGILFGAVYVVKRQADSNTRQIQLNRNDKKKDSQSNIGL